MCLLFILIKLNKGDDKMGRTKGGKNKSYTKEEKMKYVKMVLDKGYSVWDIEKEYSISHSLTNLWVKKYLEYGENSLINKKKPGNPLSKYQNKRNLTKE